MTTVFLLKTAGVTPQNQISKIRTKRKSWTRTGILLDWFISGTDNFIVSAILRWLFMTKQPTDDKSYLNAKAAFKRKKRVNSQRSQV